MIPKIIHYCWFGGKPLDALGKKCLRSWKKHFPDYEIIRWDESNVDLTSCQYAREAYAEKKWAFVSDYVRYKVLYEQGGIYFDTDVEVLRSFDDILEKGSFMGCEYQGLNGEVRVAPGLGIAAEPYLPLYREILDNYERSSFYKEDGTLNLYTIVERTTDILLQHGLGNTAKIQSVAGIYIYPSEYFCPINTNNFQLTITENTYSIHHYAASWTSTKERFNTQVFKILCRIFGEERALRIKELIKRR